MTLEEEISDRSREIHTDGYPMSIGEVVAMYKEGDLDVHPEFQRIFRWNAGQKSRLIESILLGIPIPTIFVSQRKDGVWDVIDGVQRLSTILEFMGVYKSEEKKLLPASALEGTEYLPSLNGYTFEVDNGNGKVLTEPLRREIKRAKLDFRIIKKESDENAKFDLFQRLNSGAELSQQESRNCLMVMIRPDFYKWIQELTKVSSFISTVLLSERQENEAMKDELALRFVSNVLFKGPNTYLPKIFSDYLTDWTKQTATEWTIDIKMLTNLFEKTFLMLENALGEDAFRRFDSAKGRHLGPFSISAFELFATGVALNIEKWEKAPAGRLVEVVRGAWQNGEFRSNSGTGVSAQARMPALVHLARELITP
jgi:Protein of unknown function DUF262